MAIVAAPNYLRDTAKGTDVEFYLSAPPGHRFLMYLPVWGENQEKNTLEWSTADRVPKIDKKTGQQKVGKFGPEWDNVQNDAFAYQVSAGVQPAHDLEKPRSRKPKSDEGLKPWQPMMKALEVRQTLAFSSMPPAQGMRLHATAVAPFTTGLGNEHPLENGFAFLNPYGLPYLAGSGVKGVLRAAAKELASGQWDSKEWHHAEDPRHEVREPEGKDGRQGKHLFDASDLDVLFGSEALNGENHLRGVLSFWDVIPQIDGNSLMVEIMTPHQSHYYQEDAKKGAGSTNPHDSGSPNPISFLTVPPQSQFAFHVVCDNARLEHLAPDLANNERWKVLLKEAFKHAFAWLGFGAKTSVGYGAMDPDTKAEAKLANAQAQAQAAAEKAKKMASLSDNARQVETFVQACQHKLAAMGTNGKKDKPNTDLHAKARALSKAALEGTDWTAEEKRLAAEALAEWLPQVVEVDMKDERKKLKLAVLRGEA
jgi:CRISPR-associated protein Cmr6